MRCHIGKKWKNKLERMMRWPDLYYFLYCVTNTCQLHRRPSQRRFLQHFLFHSPIWRKSDVAVGFIPKSHNLLLQDIPNPHFFSLFMYQLQKVDSPKRSPTGRSGKRSWNGWWGNFDSKEPGRGQGALRQDRAVRETEIRRVQEVERREIGGTHSMCTQPL